MPSKPVGLVGVRSCLGETIARILQENGLSVIAFTRQATESEVVNKVLCRQLYQRPQNNERIATWIYAAPIWTISEHFDWLASFGVRRIVAVSSTSRFTKIQATDLGEQVVAEKLVAGEMALQQWAKKNDVEYLILRPTMIYGYGLDKNITEIVRLAHRFRCFPLIGGANGLRQPVHVRDVATACVSVLGKTEIRNACYNLSGGEVLPYSEMVERVLGLMRSGQVRSQLFKIKTVKIPIWVMRLGIKCFRYVPRYKSITFGMLERMSQDLVFSHEEAARDFEFCPQPFSLRTEDMPKIFLQPKKQSVQNLLHP